MEYVVDAFGLNLSFVAAFRPQELETRQALPDQTIGNEIAGHGRDRIEPDVAGGLPYRRDELPRGVNFR